MVKAFVALALLAALLSGCSAADDEGVVAPTHPVTYPPATGTTTSSVDPSLAPVGPNGTLPDGWNTTLAMLPHLITGTHSGSTTADLAPNGTLTRPTSCIAYRDHAPYDVDTCVLRDANASREPEAPWIAAARWAANDRVTSEGWGTPRYVVAFDADGDPVAFWDGRYGPNTRVRTE